MNARRFIMIDLEIYHRLFYHRLLRGEKIQDGGQYSAAGTFKKKQTTGNFDVYYRGNEIEITRNLAFFFLSQASFLLS